MTNKTSRELYKISFTIMESIASSMSNKTKLPKDDFISVCNSKLELVLSKVDKKKNPKAFIRTSLNGYCLNYLRDRSRNVKLPRSIVTAYTKTRKYHNWDKNRYCPHFSQLQKEVLKEAVTNTSYYEPINKYSEALVFQSQDDGLNADLSFLSDMERLILEKIYLENYSEGDLAKELNIPQDTLRDVAKKALKNVYENCYI